MRDLEKRRYGLHLGALAAFVVGALVVGAVGNFLGGKATFDGLQTPPLTPPEWVFPVVWNTKDVDRTALLRPYFAQLAVNMLWSLFFFRLEWRLFAFFWLLLLAALVSLTMCRFRTASRTAYWLLLPYLLWVLFAGYLNLGFALLNM